MTGKAEPKSKIRLVLGSGSPRRRDLLAQLGLNFEIMVSDVDEAIDQLAPESFVRKLAEEKAQAVAKLVQSLPRDKTAPGVTEPTPPAHLDASLLPEQRPGGSSILVDKHSARRSGGKGAPVKTLILGADTIVVCDNEILGKPDDDEHAFAMLSKLSGRAHEVLTAVCLVEMNSDGSSCAETILKTSAVFFRKLAAAEIHSYINTGEPADKAGAYAMQGIASCFVERIEGCYSNVIGLPVPDTVSLLRRHGIEILGIAGGTK